MFLLLTILISIAAISLIAIVIIRIRLKEMNDELSEFLNSSYNRTFGDIPTYIKYLFHDKVISENQQKELTVHYSSNFQEAISLVKKLNIFVTKLLSPFSVCVKEYISPSFK